MSKLESKQAAEPRWRKSSYSNNEGGECVEVAPMPAAILVRDSKVAASPQLTFPAAEWATFMDATATS
ncbi:DUF397 domain-containing protein [Yinghuangia sp. YIM S09857]|uniref:DUF397 domain-containing protein n=1 Tax=Yinghuangia sp. YIM S09857 TaxID=3436929 RepID=UPI003F52E2CA